VSVRLAAFPKCYLDALVVHRTMSMFEWLELAAGPPPTDGVELYPPAFASFDRAYLTEIVDGLRAHGLQAPMMCASPDFTHPDEQARRDEIRRQREIIDVVAFLGGETCRVLSGQRRPQVSRTDGIEWTVAAISELLPHAEQRGVTLVMENHYKDGYWEFPEFAQDMDTYLTIVDRISSPWFGVNYDPSNALIAGDDPLELLEAVKGRMVTMHASDRSLEGGTLEQLRDLDADPVTGYASFVKHGVIGRGLIDYDRIFEVLAASGFDGWISIEDGDDPAGGMRDLAESAEFLHAKLTEHGLR
jgi:sugar phosphate isomerase/epimerase